VFCSQEPTSDCIPGHIVLQTYEAANRVYGAHRLHFSSFWEEDARPTGTYRSDLLLDYSMLLKDLYCFFDWEGFNGVSVTGRCGGFEHGIVDGFLGGFDGGLEERGHGVVG
jgi:hypothetical protein